MKLLVLLRSNDNFLQKFLLHALIAWLAFNIGDWLLHFYNVEFNLVYTVYKDGTPVSATDRFINNNVNQPLCFQILILAYVAELNYRFTFRKRRLFTFMISCIAWGLAASGVSLLFVKHSAFVPAAAVFTEAAVFIVVYQFSYALVFNFFHERYRQAKLGQKRSESELHLLKAQINPHFFFNTLNNLYGMALKENAGKTAGGIELLSEMMRYTMNGVTEDLISLETELKFIENYIQLQHLRIPEKESISLNINIKNPDKHFLIAPMLLIPLIENAWKYGISMEHPCFINLEITITGDTLAMSITNSVFPNHPVGEGAGLGLSNVQQRLELIYPGRHKFEIEKDERQYKINLSIELVNDKEL